MKRAIDISHWNTGLDYTSMVKLGGVEAVIIQEGYGRNRNAMFTTHVKGFQALGVEIGVYHFIYSLDVAGAKAEAEVAVKNVEAAGLPKSTYIWCDFEYDTVTYAAGKGVTLGRAECIAMTRAFCETVRAAGYPTGIYCNLDYYNNWYDSTILSEYPVWLCQLGGKTSPSKPCKVWQYSWSKRIPGYENGLDADVIFEDGDERKISPVEAAVTWMESSADDEKRGYDQIYRWGEKGDYDCSSAVITAFENASVPVKSKGGATYTGNMRPAFLKHGFLDVTMAVNLATGEGLQRGDVLLNAAHHTAMYLGGGLEVEASINEKGTATGGTPGDQTGKEFLIRTYRNYPWDTVMRYSGAEPVLSDGPTTQARPDLADDTVILTGDTPADCADGACAISYPDSYTTTVYEVKSGSKGRSVLILQRLLRGMGYTNLRGQLLGVDGECGVNTINAIKAFQADHGLTADGVCGAKTWAKVLGG